MALTLRRRKLKLTSRFCLKRNVKDFLITIEEKPRSFTTGHYLIHSQRRLQLGYLISEHTTDFVAHGFRTGFAEMDFYPVGGLADLLHKVRLSGLCGCGINIFGIHRYSFPARYAPVER